jgi:hypothetical protein
MDRTPTLAGRFGGLKEVCPPSVRDTRRAADRRAQDTLDHRKERMVKILIATIASALVALMALVLATTVAAQPANTSGLGIKNGHLFLSITLTDGLANSSHLPTGVPKQ